MRNFFKDENNKVYEYDNEQVKQGYGKDLISITEEEMLAITNPPKTEEQLLAEKNQEANSYLTQTDWVETYKLRHDLGLELIPEDSSKWEVINKREEYKTFLKSIGGN
jgi:phage-related protein